MDAIQKILVPTDFSAHADEAFRVALRLAKATGACVVVSHVAAGPAVVTAEGPSLVACGTRRGRTSRAACSPCRPGTRRSVSSTR